MSNLLNISPSPHVHGKETTRKLMFGVVLALMPALFASVFYFGIGAIIVTATSVISCIVFEYLIQRFILKKPISITDGSALVTGLLLAFNLPSNIPVFIIVIGSLVAIGIAKMTFGGLGNNPFNPALVGRVFHADLLSCTNDKLAGSGRIQNRIYRCCNRCNTAGNNKGGNKKRRIFITADGKSSDNSPDVPW